MCQYLMGASKETRARLFLVVTSDGIRGNGHKWKHRKFCLNVRKSFPPAPPRGGSISILGAFQNLTVRGPEQPAVADPALSRCGGLDHLQTCLMLMLTDSLPQQ